MNLLINLKSLVVLDPLALFFLIVISLVSLPSLIYSIGYFKNKFTLTKFLSTQLVTLAFIVSMLLLVIVGNALAFLIVWELMTLLSYLLVLTDSEKEAAVGAASIYIIMTHIGTAFLTAAFFLIFRHSGSFDLAAMAAACQTMSPLLRNWLFIFFLIGFGTKAGIVPLHIWLPYAHPQAPSHISALMSGVMIKTALYGLIRFVFLVLGISSLWWGITVLTLAIISCLVGVIYALMEHDLKKLLAYHSVENIGIILLGLGLSMVFTRLNLNNLAALAMIAGLYHLINHAAFKGLLFLCAGSVQKGSGTLDMEKLGGLIKKMPWTAAFFLVGAMGISALPPLNGFVSEWLTLQAFFSGALKVPGMLALGFAVGIAALALTSGLAAACFVKAFGITFLALPRSQNAEQAKESPASMLLGMFLLALSVVGLGLLAPTIFNLLATVTAPICQASLQTSNIFSLGLQPNSTISPLFIAILLGSGFLAAIAAYGLLQGKTRLGRTWDCGYYQIGSRNEYTATAFSKPFRISFSLFLLPFRKTEKVKDSFYHVKSFVYETYTTKIFKKYLYDAGLGLLLHSAKRFKRVQAGSIHLYISYILATLVLLILLVKIL
ncbi:MAG: proton-conducting transporter membrane subunit [Candidatus Margulisbacteria bacterium]|nr:proton-conducting transporter membrane subunit [Candidatus Margulisiibacteriota bacterium]